MHLHLLIVKLNMQYTASSTASDVSLQQISCDNRSLQVALPRSHAAGQQCRRPLRPLGAGRWQGRRRHTPGKHFWLGRARPHA